jgi:lysophospholipid acyltransferase (LPLAT)-like uncharacterized protein
VTPERRRRRRARRGLAYALDRAARRVRGSALWRGAAARLGAAWIALCWRTTRWTEEGRPRRDALIAGGGPVVAAFWHGRLFFSPLWAPPGRRTVAMISDNRDGDLITAVVARFGVQTARGSSADPRKPRKDKGGADAYAEGLAALKAGGVVAITPDGPRGPRMRAQPGVAALSIAAQAPVLPVAVSTARGRFAPSWDRFLAPLPFDRGAMLWGAPIPPPARDDPGALEAHRRAIETALNALTARADALAGRAPIPPDPAPTGREAAR